jgi:Lon protease-like protein
MSPQPDSFDPAEFGGIARLFPLPNLVLFPHVVQPLHVFEPRYRALLEASLATDQLITMALLKPGWEPSYEERPPVYDMVCLGRVTAHHKLPDGRYNLLLTGVSRARIVRELPPERLFREARVELCADRPVAEATTGARLQRSLLERFRGLLPDLPQVREQLLRLLDDEIPLGALTDIVSFALRLAPEHKQALLQELDAERRAGALLALLDRTAEGGERGDRFPPEFSAN